jgi:hypothetical protein
VLLGPIVPSLSARSGIAPRGFVGSEGVTSTQVRPLRGVLSHRTLSRSAQVPLDVYTLASGSVWAVVLPSGSAVPSAANIVSGSGALCAVASVAAVAGAVVQALVTGCSLTAGAAYLVAVYAEGTGAASVSAASAATGPVLTGARTGLGRDGLGCVCRAFAAVHRPAPTAARHRR